MSRDQLPRRRHARVAALRVGGCALAALLIGQMTVLGATGQPAPSHSAPAHSAPAQAAKSEATSTPALVKLPAPPASKPSWHLAFNQTFAGRHLDTKIWSPCFPWTAPASDCTHQGNDEIQAYAPSQVHVVDNSLRLVARNQRVATAAKVATYPWLSGMVSTRKSFDFRYGYVEVRAKITEAVGMWSAIWLLPTNGVWPPEVDIVETNGTTRGLQLQWDLHRQVGKLAQLVTVVPTASYVGWHTYALLWTPTSLTWYLDGRKIFEAAGGSPTERMYLILSLAVPGNTGWAPDASTPTANAFEVSHVEIWQQN